MATIPTRRDGGNRAGSGLLALVVILIGMSLIAAVAVTPNMAQVRDQWRMERSVERLTMLTDGLTAIFRFQEDVRGYPGALSQLSTPVANTDVNLCGGTFGGHSGNWGGRYAGRQYLTTGTPLPIGMLQDTLEYDAAGPAMVLVVTGVSEEQARYMDRRTDGSADGAAGRVRYTAADAEGRVTLRWRTTIVGC